MRTVCSDKKCYRFCMQPLRWLALLFSFTLLGAGRFYYLTWQRAQQGKPTPPMLAGGTKKPPKAVAVAPPVQARAMPPTTVPEVASKDPLFPLAGAYREANNAAGKSNKYVPFLAQEALLHAPVVVKTHVNRERHLLLQDKKFIYLLNAQLKTVWKRPLAATIKSPVYIVDFYRNKKWQYLFAAGNYWYCIDYRGNRVGRYPRKLPAGVEQFQLVDYAGNKQYRLAMVDPAGQMFLASKSGSLLANWAPKKLGKPCLSPPIHVRARTKDYFVLAHPDGTLQALNRRGEPYPGFPVQHGDGLSGVFVKKGSTAAETEITLLTQGHTLATYDLLGACIREQPLVATAGETTSALCLATTGEACCLVERSKRTFTVRNMLGEVVLRRQHEQPTRLRMQYYYWGATQLVYAITDPELQRTVLYDHAGKRMAVLRSTAGVTLLRSATKQLEAYSAFQQRVLHYKLNYSTHERPVDMA